MANTAHVPSRPIRPSGLTVWDRKLACPGYTLYCHMRGEPYVYLLGMRGEPMKTWDVGIPPHYAELLPNGNLLLLGNIPESMDNPNDQPFMLREFSWDGEVVWEFNGLNLHHDFSRLPNGNTLVIGQEVLPAEIMEKVKGGIPGTERDGKMWCDTFAEVTPEGDIAWEWHAYQHLDFEEDVICPLSTRTEWLHTNSCEPLPGGDVLTTFRLTNTAAIVDRNTGDLRWKWGRDELGHPHDPTMLHNGNVLLFDNGMHIPRLPRSRVLEVDPQTDKIVWCYEGERYMDFFSPHISGAQRLWNDNTLICDGGRGRLFEVTHDWEIVWEFLNPHHIKGVRGRGMKQWVPDDKDEWSHVGINWVFRGRRYPENYSAFIDRRL